MGWQLFARHLEHLFIISNNSGIYNSEGAILQRRITNVYMSQKWKSHIDPSFPPPLLLSSSPATGILKISCFLNMHFSVMFMQIMLNIHSPPLRPTERFINAGNEKCEHGSYSGQASWIQRLTSKPVYKRDWQTWLWADISISHKGLWLRLVSWRHEVWIHLYSYLQLGEYRLCMCMTVMGDYGKRPPSKVKYMVWLPSHDLCEK